jgi:hypothetical protein
MSNLIAVPYAKSKNYDAYGTATGESWSFSGLPCKVDDYTTAEDLFSAFNKALEAEEDEDEQFRIGDWIRDPHYRKYVSGFALVKPEIYDMLDGIGVICSRDSEGDAIANFQVAFCVQNAERLVKRVKAQ